jgi:protein-S-isoprenylcysteine O-methyltransferase Ste14
MLANRPASIMPSSIPEVLALRPAFASAAILSALLGSLAETDTGNPMSSAHKTTATMILVKQIPYLFIRHPSFVSALSKRLYMIVRSIRNSSMKILYHADISEL